MKCANCGNEKHSKGDVYLCGFCVNAYNDGYAEGERRGALQERERINEIIFRATGWAQYAITERQRKMLKEDINAVAAGAVAASSVPRSGVTRSCRDDQRKEVLPTGSIPADGIKKRKRITFVSRVSFRKKPKKISFYVEGARR